MTTDDSPKWAGGDSFRVTLKGLGGALEGLAVEGAVRDNLDGTYSASYVAIKAGRYLLSVSLLQEDEGAWDISEVAAADRSSAEARSRVSLPVGRPYTIEVLPGALSAC